MISVTLFWSQLVISTRLIIFKFHAQNIVKDTSILSLSLINKNLIIKINKDFVYRKIIFITLV